MSPTHSRRTARRQAGQAIHHLDLALGAATDAVVAAQSVGALEEAQALVAKLRAARQCALRLHTTAGQDQAS